MLKTKFTLISALMMLFSLKSMIVCAQSLTKTQLQKLYLDHLSSEGFKGEIDADGDVSFKYEGASYYIIVNPDDQEFFRIMSADVYTITESNRRRAESACTYATSQIKVAKAFISNDRVRFSIELFISKPQDFKGIFSRSMRAIQSVRRTFLERLDN